MPAWVPPAPSLLCFALAHHSEALVASHCSRSGVGAPVIGEIDGEYRHDGRRNLLEWCLPVIDAKNKSGSLEFNITGQPNDFFPVHVSFVSKKNYCNIQVRMGALGRFCRGRCGVGRCRTNSASCLCRLPK